MESQGLSVDPRHVALLADLMTSKGRVSSICTREGLTKAKPSAVLMQAALDGRCDRIFDAAFYGLVDDLRAPSERTMMGKKIAV